MEDLFHLLFNISGAKDQLYNTHDVTLIDSSSDESDDSSPPPRRPFVPQPVGQQQLRDQVNQPQPQVLPQAADQQPVAQVAQQAAGQQPVAPVFGQLPVVPQQGAAVAQHVPAPQPAIGQQQPHVPYHRPIILGLPLPNFQPGDGQVIPPHGNTLRRSPRSNKGVPPLRFHEQF